MRRLGLGLCRLTGRWGPGRAGLAGSLRLPAFGGLGEEQQEARGPDNTGGGQWH